MQLSIRPGLHAPSVVAMLSLFVISSVAPALAREQSPAPLPSQGTTTRRAIGETVTTASGLSYVFTQQGTGLRPQPGDLMVIHGIGRFTDGKEFWNTRTSGSTLRVHAGG